MTCFNFLTACANGTFGTNCTEDCGNCLDEEFCNFETGTCPSGCAPGWTGEFCKDGRLKLFFIFMFRYCLPLYLCKGFRKLCNDIK